MISRSSRLTTPSLKLISTRVLSSSSDSSWPLPIILTPTRASNSPVIRFRRRRIGLISVEKTLKGVTTKDEKLSDLSTARVFGVTSPKTSINNVMARVEIMIALSPGKKFEMMFSPRLEAAMFTKVFPRRMVARIRAGSAIIRAMSRFRGVLLFLNFLSLPYPRLKRAVSEPEKKPERHNNSSRREILRVNSCSQIERNRFSMLYESPRPCQFPEASLIHHLLHLQFPLKDAPLSL
jgi:hypothetical protein